MDHLSTTFAALADPTRRAILARLAQGETSVKELSQPFAISPPAITKHLKVLEHAGLIVRTREAQWRPCKLESAPLKEASQWIENFRASWEHSFNRLDQFLSQLHAKKESKYAHKKRRKS